MCFASRAAAAPLHPPTPCCDTECYDCMLICDIVPCETLDLIFEVLY